MRRWTPSVLLCLLAFAIVGCASSASPHDSQPSAPQLMIQYGCPTCHVIPGVPGAVGKVGPDLDDLNDSSYLAGSLPNNPRNLQLWIMHPQHYRPGIAMPEMDVNAQDAAVITGYLEQGPRSR